MGETIVNPGTEGELRLESKEAHTFAEGDVVSFRCSGSGGFGPPGERSCDALLHDVAEGYVSEQAARGLYGVETGAAPQRGGGHRLSPGEAARPRKLGPPAWPLQLAGIRQFR